MPFIVLCSAGLLLYKIRKRRTVSIIRDSVALLNGEEAMEFYRINSIVTAASIQSCVIAIGPLF